MSGRTDDPSLSLDAQRVLGKTRVMKSRLKIRVAQLSTLIDSNKQLDETLKDLNLRSSSLEEELDRIKKAEQKRKCKMPTGQMLHLFEEEGTCGGLLRSCHPDNARDFLRKVADVRAALEQLLGRTIENAQLALKEQVTLEETHKERMRDGAEASKLIRESAERMQLRIEKKALQEKIDYQETEKLQMLIQAKKAEIELYEAKRTTLKREKQWLEGLHGPIQTFDMKPAPAPDSNDRLHERIIETLAKALEQMRTQH